MATSVIRHDPGSAGSPLDNCSHLTRAAIPNIGSATPCGRIMRDEALASCSPVALKRNAVSTSRVLSIADLPGPRNNEVNGIQRRLLYEATSTSASKALRAVVPSAAGKAWATFPPIVATLRTCGPPTT